MCSIIAVSHFKLGNPLVVVRSALYPDSSYFGDFSKADLNPLVYVVGLSRPGASFSSTSGFVKSRVRRSMVTVPLEI